MYLRLTESAEKIGGANRMIQETIRLIDRERFTILPCFIINRNRSESRQDEHGDLCGLPSFSLYGKRGFDACLLDRLGRLVEDHEIEVIHSHDYKSDLYAVLLKRKNPHLKLMTTLHGYIRNTFKSRVYVWLDRQLMRFFDRIIAVSSKTADEVKPAWKDKVTLLHNAIDLEKWAKEKETENDDVFCVGFAGRISREKGWEDFVRVAARLAQYEGDYRFRIAGEGPRLKRMQERVDALGMTDRFEFLGPVSDMISFYESLDALLAPSRSEGMPVAQLEANAMEVPVVATRVGGVEDLIDEGRNGFLADAGDVDRLTERVRELKNDPELRLRMGRNGRAVVEDRFSLRDKVMQLESIYTDLVREEIEVEFIDSIDRLREIEGAWMDLLKQSESNDLFLVPEFFHAWWAHCAEGYSLYFCALWKMKRLEGLVPLYKKRTGVFRVLNFTGQPSLADRMDLILRKGSERDCIGAWAKWLCSRKDWDLLELKNMAPFSRNAQLLQSALEALGSDNLLQEDSRYPYIRSDSHPDFDAFVKSLGRGARRSFEKTAKRISSQGDIEWSFTDRYDEALIDAMIELDAEKSRRGAAGRAFFRSAEKTAFLKAFLRSIEGRGMFRIYTYRMMRQLLSHLLVFQYNNKVLAYQIAYDPVHTKMRPGIQSLFNAIRDMFDEGVGEFDLLKGDESYKTGLAAQSRQSFKLLGFRKSLLSRSLYLYFRFIKPMMRRKKRL